MEINELIMPVRIYDIAKNLGLESKVVLQYAKELGIPAKVPSSALDKITAEYLQKLISSQITEERIQRVLQTGATELDLHRLGLTKLPESFEKLRYLKELQLQENYLTEVPESIRQLTGLEYLRLDVNRLSVLPEFIGELKELKELHLDNNRLIGLPDSVGNLTNLQVLYLYSNRLKALPESIRNLQALRILSLHSNDELGLPREVLGPHFGEEGTPSDPYAILDYYFRIRTGKRPLNEAKLIVIGRGFVGKTCLIKRLLFDTFDQKEKETPGIEIQPWEVKVSPGERIRLHVWDFGGQEILHATHQFFLTERTLYLLVLSGREGKATEDAEYWLQLIRSFGGDSKVIIALNKSVQHPFDVNRGFLLEKYPFIVDFAKTDCDDRTGLEELKRQILTQCEAMEHRKADFPADWFAIKERLAEMTKRNENYVTWEQYQGICREFGEKDGEAQRKLAWYLNVLGIALNYRDDARLKDTHVLNPRWVTEGIYPLLRKGQSQERQGVLELKDLATTLDAKKYPSDKHEFLIGLMEKFQLCFPLPDRIGKPKRWLVPELLGENQPDIKALLEEPGLGFRYQYEVLPEGLLPRFIVQTHLHSDENPQWRWRTGVVLEWEDCRAVVRADYRERRVDIHVTGPEARRRELLAIVREKFQEQHRDLKGLNVDERVIVPAENGVTVSYRDLLQREEDDEEEFRPEGARQKVRVTELLNGVESQETRTKRREKEEKVRARDVIIVQGPTTIQTGDKTMELSKTTNINVGTNYGQVGEILNGCTNIINEQPEGTVKQLLDTLHADVKCLINALPQENSDLKKDVAENLKLLIQSTSAGNPKRRWYSVSAEGLLEASKFAKDFTGNIAGTVGKLGKLFWPDFELPGTEREK